MISWINTQGFIRNIDGSNLLEVFLVTAVSSIVAIRFFLGITGYPKVAGGGLHIAHVLVGGLFMMAALVILLAFLDKGSKNLAAFLGGFGFGAFIDELGKFVTNDNNYFFQPTFGLIYIVFVLIYLVIQHFIRSGRLSENERLVNVLEITKEAVVSNLDAKEKQQAMDLLADSDSSDAVAKSLKESLNTVQLVPMPKQGLYTKAKEHASSVYQWLIKRRWFTNLLIAIFVINSIISFLVAINMTVGIPNAIFWAVAAFSIISLYRALTSRHSAVRRLIYAFAIFILILILLASILIFILDLTLPVLSITEWGQLVFSGLSGTLGMIGAVLLRNSRLAAYNLLKSSVR